MARMKKAPTEKVARDAGASAPAPFSPDTEALIEAMEKEGMGDRLTTLSKKSTVITSPKFLSTQHIGLDALLGGGIPAGRFVEIFSHNEGSGKTSLAMHILAECQRTGGIAVLIDMEKGVTTERLETLGVDTSKLLYFYPKYLEKVYEIIEALLKHTKKMGIAQRTVIVLDSIAATPTKAQFEAGYNDPMQVATLARSLSFHLPKFADTIMEIETYFIAINQSRSKIGVLYGSKHTTSGGKAMKFQASIRLKLDVKTKIKNAKGVVDGIVVRASTEKNKIAAPFRSTEINILFDRGIDTQRSLFDFLVGEGVIDQGGAWNSMPGCEKKFQYKDFVSVLSALTAEGVDIVCSALEAKNITTAAIQRFFPEYSPK